MNYDEEKSIFYKISELNEELNYTNDEDYIKYIKSEIKRLENLLKRL